MTFAIPLSHILDKLADLLPLTYDQLNEMTSKQLRDNVAKILGVPKAYQLKKAELLQTCWLGLENLRAQLQVAEADQQQAKVKLSQLKKNEDYQIPVAEVAAKTYARLREFAQKEPDLQRMKEATNGLVATVSSREMKEFEFSTVKNRRLDIKKAMDLMVNVEALLMRDTMQTLVEYFYHQLLSFQREDSIILNKDYKTGVKEKNLNKPSIEISQLVTDCLQTLEQLENGKELHWTKVSVAFALGTGRRMAEVHSLGSFEVTGEFSFHFSGQAKTRNALGAKDDYEIPTLFPAATLKLAIDYLEKQGRRLDPEIQKADRNAVNRTYAMHLSRAMSKYPNVNYKGLRAIYAECQWALLPDAAKVKTSQHSKYSEWLGHIGSDGAIDTTFVSYMVFNVIDIDAVRGLLKK